MIDYREQRKYPRASFRPPVVGQWRGQNKSGRGTLSNMSPRGCYLLTNKPAQFGEQVFISIGNEIPEIESLVRYVDSEVGMGVEFIGMKLETDQKLYEFLQAKAVAWN